MCGILGTLPNTEHYFFKDALAKIAHRGPDGFGIWHQEEGRATFGHRRLAILDLSDAGKQPMQFEHYVIIFNGEIYNFIEIRQELKNAGYQFFSDSDTEVVLAAFDFWKEKCLDKFNGMWAMAIWNEKEKTLFLSRDRFGKKPLFYAFEEGKLIFASEMKAIMPFLKNCRRAEDFDFFVKNIFLYESTEKCLIEGIKRFPAGSFAYFRPEDKELKPYTFWKTRFGAVNVPKTYEEQTEMFREIFFDACKIRMRSDVPIGTALSGGVDSSAVISTMAHMAKNQSERLSADWQHAFVAVFPGSFIDESVYAKKVTDNLGVKADFIPVNPAEGIENLYKHLYLFEEIYLTSPLPMMTIYNAVKKNGVVVSIDGHGADELLSGYGKSLYEAFLDCGINFKDISDIMRTYKGLYENPAFKGSMSIKKQNFLDYLRFIKMRKGTEGAFDFWWDEWRNFRQKGARGAFNEHLYELFHQSVLPTLLRNYDRYAMGNSVEIRMPFMDYRLVEFCFSLPWNAKIRNGFTKSILRDAVKDLVPQDVLYRKFKIGFNSPFTEWLKNEWKDFVSDTLESVDFKQSDIIKPVQTADFVRNVIKNPNANFQDGENAWRMLMPYFWQKAMFSENKALETENHV